MRRIARRSTTPDGGACRAVLRLRSLSHILLVIVLANTCSTSNAQEPQDFGCLDMGMRDELCVVAANPPTDEDQPQSCQAEWNGVACESCNLCEGSSRNSTTSTFAYQCQGAAEAAGDGLDNPCVNYDCNDFCMGATTTMEDELSPTAAPAGENDDPIPEGATQFTLFDDSEIVCSDSLDNVCTAPVEPCSPADAEQSAVFVAGNNVNVEDIVIEDGVWIIVGGYTISFPEAQDEGCVVTCVGGGCVCDVCEVDEAPTAAPVAGTEEPTETVVAPTASPTFSEQPVAAAVDDTTPTDRDSENSSTTSTATMTMSRVANLGLVAGVVWTMMMMM